MSFDPLTSDPVTFDPDYPADTFPVTLDSGGVPVFGVLYVPQGVGPHPALLLLHGFPGSERNFDLAQLFRRAGWSVLVFHYRGTWGSGGDFTFGHVLEDAAVAVAWLRSDTARTTFRVDGSRLALVGHSMGGWAALMTTAADPTLKTAVSFAGWNIGMDMSMVAEGDVPHHDLLTYFDRSTERLHGASGAALLAEGLAHVEDWNLVHHAPALADRRLLLIAAGRDSGTPPPIHHTPLVYALEKNSASALTHQVIESDHSFNDRRLTLGRAILDWLR
ncbi:MAG: alpha/beta fold hydrolase [Anaerolineae bacterium]|nr:alpha/beta fold hydrolase [Anaerolineae bacterium]